MYYNKRADLGSPHFSIKTQNICAEFYIQILNYELLSYIYTLMDQIFICGTNCIETFKAHRTQNHLRQLPLPSFYYSAASNSGPIALLYQKYNAK